MKLPKYILENFTYEQIEVINQCFTAPWEQDNPIVSTIRKFVFHFAQEETRENDPVFVSIDTVRVIRELLEVDVYCDYEYMAEWVGGEKILDWLIEAKIIKQQSTERWIVNRSVRCEIEFVHDERMMYKLSATATRNKLRV